MFERENIISSAIGRGNLFIESLRSCFVTCAGLGFGSRLFGPGLPRIIETDACGPQPEVGLRAPPPRLYALAVTNGRERRRVEIRTGNRPPRLIMKLASRLPQLL